MEKQYEYRIKAEICGEMMEMPMRRKITKKQALKTIHILNHEINKIEKATLERREVGEWNKIT